MQDFCHRLTRESDPALRMRRTAATEPGMWERERERADLGNHGTERRKRDGPRDGERGRERWSERRGVLVTGMPLCP